MAQATRQHGVISTVELRRFGLREKAIRWRAETGILHQGSGIRVGASVWYVDPSAQIEPKTALSAVFDANIRSFTPRSLFGGGPLFGERLQETGPLRRDDLERAGGFLERATDDVSAAQRRHLPPVPLGHEIGGLVADAGPQHPVEEGGGPA